MARQPRRLARLGASPDLATQALFDAYIGPYGEPTAHPGGLRLHDGSTPGGIPLDGSLPMTQVRLDYVSTTQIRMAPFNGNYLWINGRNVAVPNAGITLSNTGLSELTVYFIYAYVSGSTIALEASTTVHASHPSGVRTKNGDVTRTLVGAVYTDTGGIFANMSTKRYVRSFYSRPQMLLNSAYVSGSTTSTTPVNINPTSLSASFFAFSDDTIDFTFVGDASNTTGATITQLAIDDSLVGSRQVSSGSTGDIPLSPRALAQRADGMRTLTLRGSVNTGTGAWRGIILGSVS